MDEQNFITVLGWEDRFIEGIKITFKKYQIKKLILITFSDYLSMDKMIENKKQLFELAELNNINIVEINLEYNNSIGNWKILDNFFKKNMLKNILIGITTIPRETIWTLLFYLNKSECKNINYIYFKPNEYNSGWLTKNHKTPRLLFKHSGVFEIDKKLALFVITGFDTSRLIQLIDFYEPSKLVLFNQTGNQYDNSKRNKEIDELPLKDIKCIEIDSYNLIDSSSLIFKEINNYREFNIILVSNGPKTSSISTYDCFRKSNKTIGLSYVPARDFNTEYSKGINDKYIFGRF